MKELIGVRDRNSICEEWRDVSDVVVVRNGSKTVLLLLTQKQSLSWISGDPLRRLQYWLKDRQRGRVFHRTHIH